MFLFDDICQVLARYWRDDSADLAKLTSACSSLIIHSVLRNYCEAFWKQNQLTFYIFLYRTGMDNGHSL